MDPTEDAAKAVRNIEPPAAIGDSPFAPGVRPDEAVREAVIGDERALARLRRGRHGRTAGEVT